MGSWKKTQKGYTVKQKTENKTNKKPIKKPDWNLLKCLLTIF